MKKILRQNYSTFFDVFIFYFFIYTFLTFPLQRCFLFFVFFFFSFDLPFVMMLFVFSFFGFAKRWVLLLFLLFFSLNFIFIIFLKKTLLDDFLFYFLKCPLSFDKFIRTLFSTKPNVFYISTFPTFQPNTNRKTKNFFILLLFHSPSIFILSLFYPPNQTDPKEYKKSLILDFPRSWPVYHINNLY